MAYSARRTWISRQEPHHVSYNYEGRDKRAHVGPLRVAFHDAPCRFKVTSITAHRGYNDVTRNDQGLHAP